MTADDSCFQSPHSSLLPTSVGEDKIGATGSNQKHAQVFWI